MNTPLFSSSLANGLLSGVDWFLRRFVMLVVVLCLAGGVALAQDDDDDDDDDGPCSETADAAYKACQNEVNDDYWIAIGNCLNISDPEEREECLEEAEAERRDARALCREQLEARLDLCEDLGEGRYDPEIDPDDFVDPAEIGDSVDPNPYFPLVPGTTLVYQGGSETVTFTVTDDTKEILGVTTAVIHDVVEDNGEVIEDTNDWFAQDEDGNVWYFGEIAQDFEDGELVSIDGSWTAGVDFAKPGIIMKADPEVGDVYRQEFSLGNAEDAAEVLSLTGSATVPAASCTDCLITEDFTPIEPDAAEHKYYKPGVGLILELNPETGDRLELVQIQGAQAPGAVTSADRNSDAAVPSRFGLSQNFPNPFNPTTEIRFDLNRSGQTTLKVFNTLGQEVATLVDGDLPAGSHRVTFDFSTLPAGAYLYQLEAGGMKEVRKMILTK